MTLDDFMDVTAMFHAGVYALTWRNKVVYVGKSNNILRRLHEHRMNGARNRGLYPWEPKSNKMQFDGMQYIPLRLDELDRVERQMINRYRPRYNVHHKPPSEVPHTAPTDVDMGGITFTLNAPPKVLGLVRRV